MQECQVYRVNHKALFRRVFCVLSLTLLILFVVGVVIGVLWGGLVEGRDVVVILRSLLKKLSTSPAVVALSGGYVIAVLCIKLISVAMVSFQVTLSDTAISGRSGMGRQRTLPLEDLKEINGFSISGFCGFFLISRSHGDILIPLDLCDAERLFTSLEAYLPMGPDDSRLNPPADRDR